MLIYSPTVHHKEHFMYTSSRSRLVTVGWMWNSEKPDTGYESNLIIDWLQISKAIGKLNSQRVDLKIGLLNFHKEEINTWQSILPRADVSVVHLDHIQKNVTWEDLYPEWIDEEEESEVPSCPNFPDPKLSKKAHFDVVAVKLPCRGSKSWSRDVARLHLQLAVAKIAAETTNFQKPVFVLIVSRCLPIPNLFKCKYLAFREGDVWVYKPEPRELRENLQLPVGSCKLALPFKAKEQPYLPSSHRVAYATILHSESVYVCGAITVAQSIRQAGSTIDLFGADPSTLYVLHYLGLKPWSCYRDYDCNWNVDILQEFASDVAHARWWKVHDRMTTYLQSFCLLSEKQKGQLEWDRIQAKKANYSDVHWKRTINDPRRNICNEEICSLLMLPEYHFLAIIYVGENNSACDEPAFHPRLPK